MAIGGLAMERFTPEEFGVRFNKGLGKYGGYEPKPGFRYYHVAGADYQGGDLYCWHLLDLMGVCPAWKWADWFYGYHGPGGEYPDRKLVCVTNYLVEAIEFQDVHGGAIYEVDLSVEAIVRFRLELDTAAEGYLGVRWRIPAPLLTLVDVPAALAADMEDITHAPT